MRERRRSQPGVPQPDRQRRPRDRISSRTTRRARHDHGQHANRPTRRSHQGRATPAAASRRRSPTAYSTRSSPPRPSVAVPDRDSRSPTRSSSSDTTARSASSRALAAARRSTSRSHSTAATGRSASSRPPRRLLPGAGAGSGEAPRGEAAQWAAAGRWIGGMRRIGRRPARESLPRPAPVGHNPTFADSRRSRVVS